VAVPDLTYQKLAPLSDANTRILPIAIDREVSATRGAFLLMVVGDRNASAVDHGALLVGHALRGAARMLASMI
jgi:hypothetical protein